MSHSWMIYSLVSTIRLQFGPRAMGGIHMWLGVRLRKQANKGGCGVPNHGCGLVVVLILVMACGYRTEWGQVDFWIGPKSEQQGGHGQMTWLGVG